MQTMYDGMVNSPETTITNNISNSDTIIYVLDPSRVPAELPNLMTLGNGTNAETVIVTAIDDNALTVERGFQGTPAAWNAGTVIARNFTEYDYNALKENILELDSNKEPLIKDATSKTTPVDADTLPLTDSAASGATKKITWSNIKTALKAYFDTKYVSLMNLVSTDNEKGASLVGIEDADGHYEGNTVEEALAEAANLISTLSGEVGDKQDSTDNSLPTADKTIVGAITEVFTSASNGKALIAAAITGKNVPTEPTDTYQTMADNIGLLGNAQISLYKNGDQYSDITGGWTRTTYTYVNVSHLTLGASSMTGSLATATQSRVMYRATVSQIDFTNFTKLKIKLTGTYAGTGFFIARLHNESSGNLSDLVPIAFVTSSTSGTDTVVELDVSSINLAYLIVQIGSSDSGSGSASCEIKEIWIE